MNSQKSSSFDLSIQQMHLRSNLQHQGQSFCFISTAIFYAGCNNSLQKDFCFLRPYVRVGMKSIYCVEVVDFYNETLQHLSNAVQNGSKALEINVRRTVFNPMGSNRTGTYSNCLIYDTISFNVRILLVVILIYL